MGLEEEVNVLCALTLRKRGTSESRQELMESEMKKEHGCPTKLGRKSLQ